MKIIEFFGATRVGKSFLFKKFVTAHNKKNIFTYKTIFYFYLFKSNKISYLKYLLVKFLIINEVGKSKNLFIKIFSNFYFKIEETFKNDKKVIISKFSTEYKKFIFFYNYLSIQVKNKKEQNILKKWTIDVLIGHYLSKKKQYNGIIVTPEGIYQRILSLYKRSNISIKSLKKLIFLCPEIDQVFFIKKNNRNNVKIEAIFKLIKKKKINNSVVFNKRNYKDNLKILTNILNK